MNYLVVYEDKDNKPLKEIHSSGDGSLAEIHAISTAYKNNYKLLSINHIDINKLLNDSITNINLFINELYYILKNKIDDNIIFLNNLSEIFIADGFKFYENNINKITVKQILIIDKLKVFFYGSANVYGAIKCTSIEVYNNYNLIYKNIFH